MPNPSSNAKSARLKAALRENLKRRKAQARGRETAPSTDPAQAPATLVGNGLKRPAKGE